MSCCFFFSRAFEDAVTRVLALGMGTWPGMGMGMEMGMGTWDWEWGWGWFLCGELPAISTTSDADTNTIYHMIVYISIYSRVKLRKIYLLICWVFLALAPLFFSTVSVKSIKAFKWNFCRSFAQAIGAIGIAGIIGGWLGYPLCMYLASCSLVAFNYFKW